MSISIHAAREGGDFSPLRAASCSAVFQSTPPVKAATLLGVSQSDKDKISIHAAREGGDYR